MNDLFLFPPANDSLQPENLWNYEIGLVQSVWQQKIQFEVTAFIMDGENLIMEVPTGMPGPPQRRNTGSFTNKGIELQTKFKARKNLNFLLNYSFLDASESVLYAPEHNLGFQTRYSIKKLSIHAGLQHIAGLNTTLLTENEQENYTLLNARVSLEAAPWLQVFINGDNLLDTEYEVEKGYPMPGINVLGGINVHF